MNELLNIIAKDNEIIPYRKELNTITGGITASILLQQIIYWYVKNEYKPFYKFIEPCTHEKYNNGDSWCEELGFSRKEFITAIKKLEDNGLVSKKTNMQRLTYYTLNLGDLGKALKGIYVNAKKGFIKMPKGDLDYKETETTTENINTVESSDSDIDNSLSNEKSKVKYSECFEILWNKYDKKTGNKSRAYKIYLQKYKNKSNEQMIEAIEKYKVSLETWRTLKDFDGFLNGIVDIYLPKRAYLIDRNNSKHIGYFYDSENKFISDLGRGLELQSSDIATHIQNKRFGYIGA